MQRNGKHHAARAQDNLGKDDGGRPGRLVGGVHGEPLNTIGPEAEATREALDHRPVLGSYPPGLWPQNPYVMDRGKLVEHMRGREIQLHPGVSQPPRFSTPGKPGAPMPNTLLSQAAAFRPPAKFDAMSSYDDEYRVRPRASSAALRKNRRRCDDS